MVQSGEDSPFPAEARLFAGVHPGERDDLQRRHGEPRHLVVRAVDDAHAASPDLALDEL